MADSTVEVTVAQTQHKNLTDEGETSNAAAADCDLVTPTIQVNNINLELFDDDDNTINNHFFNNNNYPSSTTLPLHQHNNYDTTSNNSSAASSRHPTPREQITPTTSASFASSAAIMDQFNSAMETSVEAYLQHYQDAERAYKYLVNNNNNGSNTNSACTSVAVSRSNSSYYYHNSSSYSIVTPAALAVAANQRSSSQNNNNSRHSLLPWTAATLPTDILINIFSYLYRMPNFESMLPAYTFSWLRRDYVAVSLVSKSWNRASRDNQMWREVSEGFNKFLTSVPQPEAELFSFSEGKFISNTDAQIRTVNTRRVRLPQPQQQQAVVNTNTTSEAAITVVATASNNTASHSNSCYYFNNYLTLKQAQFNTAMQLQKVENARARYC